MKIDLLLTAALFLFCGVVHADNVVSLGKTVVFQYTEIVDGRPYESSLDTTPLTAQLGKKQLIPGLEKNLLGMHVGEERTFDVQPKDGYGDPDPTAIKDIPLSSLPKASRFVGATINTTAPDGHSLPAKVKAIKGEKVTIDFNHPLAGKVIHFWVKLYSIK